MLVATMTDETITEAQMKETSCAFVSGQSASVINAVLVPGVVGVDWVGVGVTSVVVKKVVEDSVVSVSHPHSPSQLGIQSFCSGHQSDPLYRQCISRFP